MMFRTSVIAVTLAMAFAVTATQPTAATSANPKIVAAETQYPCGYDGYHGGQQPDYNHCGRTDVAIRVHHFFWQTTYDCVTPGVHQLEQGNSQWRIISAEYDGHSCNVPGAIVGP